MTAPTPIRRSFSCNHLPLLENLDKVIEEAPAPYCYMIAIAPEAEREAVKQRFMHEANMKRWWHLYKADLPGRKETK